tara:strand:+ start:66 stop:662 length:597 start_codon:yes stop_codon:yes gene_type:complete
MKNIEIISKKNPNFIGCWNIENKTICDDIIKFFEDNPNLQHKGETASGHEISRKKTTDITISPKDLSNPEYKVFQDYFEVLQKCFLDYREQWPFLKKFLNKVNIPSFNVQKYLSGDHFSALHSERTHLVTLHRIFAFMSYLNDVDDGGTTDFDYYGLKIKPEKGKTLIWPAEWTHAHTGSILKSGSKYIITGWFNFAE